VLAVALYSLMKQQKFDGSHESFPAFLKRQIRTGTLGHGQIEKLNREFFGG
jgi:hypothetical protein